MSFARFARWLIGIALALSTGVGAEPASAGAPPVRSYGDYRIVKMEEELPEFLAANATLVGSVTAKKCTFNEALARARALAKQAGGEAALAALKQTIPNLDAAMLRALAVVELGRGNQAGVLVLLVGALDRAPDDADNLFNVASILVAFGFANEALAIVEELARRGAAPSPPMGLSGGDMTEYLSGYSLALAGNLPEARRRLERVRDRQPLLAEAARTLALIDEKEGKDPRRNFLLGVWRHRGALQICGTGSDRAESGDPFREGGEIAMDAEALLDWSKARKGVLPTVPFAGTMEAATSMRPGYEKLAEESSEKSRAIAEATARLKPRAYKQTDGGPEETWGKSMQEVMELYFKHFPKIAAADQEFLAARRARTEGFAKISDASDDRVSDAILGDARRKKQSPGPHEMGVSAKPFRDAALAEARPLINREETAIRKRFDLWHQMATAVGGQIGDPVWRAWVQGQVEYEREITTRTLLSLVSLHAGLGEQPGYDAAPLPPPGNADASDLAACDGTKSIGIGLGQIGAVRGLSPVTLSAELSCEGFSAEIGVEVLPLVSLSGELGINTKGEIGAFIGPKAEAGIAGVGGGSVKGGFYITGGRDGFHDVGVKAEAKTLGTLHGTGVANKVGEGSFSFLPGPESRPPVADLMPLIVR